MGACGDQSLSDSPHSATCIGRGFSTPQGRMLSIMHVPFLPQPTVQTAADCIPLHTRVKGKITLLHIHLEVRRGKHETGGKLNIWKQKLLRK